MKTIGLIGGLSWQSSADYYRLTNELTADRLGGLHSAPCVLHSVDFAEIERFQQTDEWNAAGELLADAALSIQAAATDLPATASTYSFPRPKTERSSTA